MDTGGEGAAVSEDARPIFTSILSSFTASSMVTSVAMPLCVRPVPIGYPYHPHPLPGDCELRPLQRCTLIGCEAPRFHPTGEGGLQRPPDKGYALLQQPCLHPPHDRSGGCH